MSEMTPWMTFLLIGLGTFAVRLSFIEFYAVLRIPPLFRRALAYVPASVLAALVLPLVAWLGGNWHGSWIKYGMVFAAIAHGLTQVIATQRALVQLATHSSSTATP